MITQSYGYITIENGDTGQPVFTALNANILRLNDHTHNGVNSAKLTITSVDGIAQNILSAAWVPTTGGYFRQVVTLPPGLTWDKFTVTFNTPVLGYQAYPTVERLSTTTYYVYTIDSAEGFIAVYV